MPFITKFKYQSPSGLAPNTQTRVPRACSLIAAFGSHRKLCVVSGDVHCIISADNVSCKRRTPTHVTTCDVMRDRFQCIACIHNVKPNLAGASCGLSKP